MAHAKNTKQTDVTKTTTTADPASTNEQQNGREELRTSPMMAQLLDTLESGTNIGHYGRLTFVMVARHFLSEDELVDLLSQQPDHTTADSCALVHQVKAHDYNPPSVIAYCNGNLNKTFPSALLQMIMFPAMSIENYASRMGSMKTLLSSMRSRLRLKQNKTLAIWSKLWKRWLLAT